jgi:hypothetical protein
MNTAVVESAIPSQPRSLIGEITQTEELLVVDARASLRPAQIVEDRLVHLLNQPVVLVSQVRSSSPSVRRSHC